MITLYDLVKSHLINDGDTVYFQYKDHVFSATVTFLGTLVNCYMDSKQIYVDDVPFESPSDFADRCIQVMCKEYVTRFSAWKRLFHQQSGLCLNSLRQLHSQFQIPKTPVTFMSLTSLRQYLTSSLKYIEVLEKRIEDWEEFQGGKTALPPDDFIPKPTILNYVTSMHSGYLMAMQNNHEEQNVVKAHCCKSKNIPVQS